MYRKDQDEKKADGQRYVGLAWHEKHNINGFGGLSGKYMKRLKLGSILETKMQKPSRVCRRH